MSSLPSSSTSTSAIASSSTEPAYPAITKGASLLIAYQLRDRPVLLIGGGAVASGRLFFLLESGAHVTLVAPSPLDPSIAHRLTTNPTDITYHDRAYLGRDDPVRPEHFAMVLTAIDDNALSRTVCFMAREVHVPVNVADVPPECDFYFGAQLRRGPLQVMISTQGQGPKIGAMVRDRIVQALPDNVEEAIAGVGQLRADLRRRAPGVGGQLGKERMEWMIGICDAWGLDEMGGLREEEVRAHVLDQGWEKGRRVVRPEEALRSRSSRGAGMRRKAREALQVFGGPPAVLGFVTGSIIGAVAAMAYLRRR